MVERKFERLIIPIHVWDSMQAHVETETPFEACGILGGKQSGVDLHARLSFPARNELRSTHRYRMDAHDQLNVFNELEERGLDLVGIYHSHPQGPQSPSATDVEQAYYPDSIYLIWAFLAEKWDCRGYIIREKKVREIQIIVSGTIIN